MVLGVLAVVILSAPPPATVLCGTHSPDAILREDFLQSTVASCHLHCGPDPKSTLHWSQFESLSKCATCLSLRTQIWNHSPDHSANRSLTATHTVHRIADLCNSTVHIQAAPVPIPRNETQITELWEQSLFLIPAQNNFTEVSTFVWRWLLTLPISLRFRIMGALDAANIQEANFVLQHTEHLVGALKNFKQMRLNWRSEIRRCERHPHVSLVSLLLGDLTQPPNISTLRLAFLQNDPESPRSLVSNLVNSTAHVHTEYCRFMPVFNSLHASLANHTFENDPSCSTIGGYSDASADVVPVLTAALIHPERFAEEDNRIVHALFRNPTSAFPSFLEVSANAQPQSDSLDGSISFIQTSEPPMDMASFGMIQKEFGVQRGDSLGMYKKIWGAQLEPYRKHAVVDPSGKIVGVDLNFLDSTRDLLGTRDLAADPKGYFKRKALREQRRRIREQKIIRDNFDEWNFSSEDEEMEKSNNPTNLVAPTTPVKSANDIKESLSTEALVMRTMCHNGMGRDLRDSLAMKVQTHVGTECIDMIAGFIGPVVSPVIGFAMKFLIPIIGKALVDAMADCVTFRLVGELAPKLEGMLARMMVPPMSMGIIMILPQALTKVLETKFKVMLGAPLAQAVVKSVLRYRSQVSTPTLYHTISHSLSHSVESVLSASLAHTVTNTAGSALAHSLSHALPAYYACMRCYHNRVAGVARVSGDTQDDCATCYMINSLSTQERQAFAAPQVQGYRSARALAVPSVTQLASRISNFVREGSLAAPPTNAEAASSVVSAEA